MSLILDNEKKLRDEKAKSKPQALEQMRAWATPLPDLELVNISKPLVKPDNVKDYGIDENLFSDLLSIFQFFKSGLYTEIVTSIEDSLEDEEVESKFVRSLEINFMDLQTAVKTSNHEGMLVDLLFCLLPIVSHSLKLQTENDATLPLRWCKNSLHTNFFDIPIDSVTVTEVVRLFFLSHGYQIKTNL